MTDKCAIIGCNRPAGDVLWHGREICNYHMNRHIISPEWPEYLFKKLKVKKYNQLTLR